MTCRRPGFPSENWSPTSENRQNKMDFRGEKDKFPEEILQMEKIDSCFPKPSSENELDFQDEQKKNNGDPNDFLSEGSGSHCTNSLVVDTGRDSTDLLYGVEDTPPMYLCVFLGLQQLMMALAGALSLSSTLSELVCAQPTDSVRSTLFSSTLFMNGLCTLIQPALGNRLPIFQGASSSFLLPLLALKNVDDWKCKESGIPVINATEWNMTSPEMLNNPDHEESILWRIRELQGSLVLASSIQMLIGCTGLIGFLLRFIGPITVIPTISLIGLSLFRVVLIYAPNHWGITAMTTLLIIIFSIFLKNVNIPIPSYNRQSGLKLSRFPFFKVFPIILSIMIGWLLCYILTLTDAIPNDPSHVNYFARTDVREELIVSAPWVYFPHPGQYGIPSFNTGAFLGMMAATMASTIESIGDYYACAKVCGLPPPPKHAINRGIAMEGLGSILSGLLGTGHGTTSYSGNIGAIGITKVASRRVFYVAGILTMVISVVGKASAVLVSIPYPVLGGVQIVIFGILTSIGISGIQYIDVNSSRNLTIIGVAIFCGLLLPEWLIRTPGAITTGYAQLDQVVTVVIGTPMFIGGIIAFFLDNISPGTTEERGMRAWHPEDTHIPSTNTSLHVYYPLPCINYIARKFPFSRHLPFLPAYNEAPRKFTPEHNVMEEKQDF